MQIEISGVAAGMGYCHCKDCRHWSAGPINAFSLWPPESVNIMSGEEHIESYAKTENSNRKWCKKCGGAPDDGAPENGLVDVYVAVPPALEFEPAVHIFYGEKTVSVKDGLPEMRDLPAKMGGTGESLSE